MYVLLGRTGDLATMAAATCECAAGYATSLLSTQFYMYILNTFHHAASHFIYMYISQKCASCTHVSVLLHVLVAMTLTRFLLQSNLSTETKEDEALTVTSYACQWKAPRKHKESNLPMSEAQFEKHVYGKRIVRMIEI